MWKAMLSYSDPAYKSILNKRLFTFLESAIEDNTVFSELDELFNLEAFLSAMVEALTDLELRHNAANKDAEADAKNLVM